MGPWPLRGSREGDRFALSSISLALDQVDATQVLDGRAGAYVPDERVIADTNV